MNLKKLLARVQRALPTLAPGTFGENDIIDLLNEAQLNIATVSTKTTALKYDIDESTDSIPFPPDMLRLVNVFWGKDKKELEASMNNYMMVDEIPTENAFLKGEPSVYYVEDGRIVFRPVPLTSNEMTVVYTRKPTEMKDDKDTPDIEGVEEYLIAYALYRIHMEVGSPSLQLWDQERMRALAVFTSNHEQNYSTPFKIVGRW